MKKLAALSFAVLSIAGPSTATWAMPVPSPVRRPALPSHRLPVSTPSPALDDPTGVEPFPSCRVPWGYGGLEGTHGEAVPAGDLTGDGREDVLVAGQVIAMQPSSMSGFVAAYRGTDGEELWRNSLEVRSCAVAGDVTGDQISDVVTLEAPQEPERRLTVFNGATGSRLWGAKLIQTDFVWLVGDTNGDGETDLVVGTLYGGIGDWTTFRGDDGSVLHKAVHALPAAAVTSTVVPDLNRDHVADLVVSQSGLGLLRIQAMTLDGAPLWQSVTAAAEAFYSIVPAALDADPVPDLILEGRTSTSERTSLESFVFATGADGRILWTAEFTGPENGWDYERLIPAGTLDHDSGIDVFQARPSSNGWELSGRSGLDGRPLWGPVAVAPAMLCERFVDVDRDGALDATVFRHNDNFSVTLVAISGRTGRESSLDGWGGTGWDGGCPEALGGDAGRDGVRDLSILRWNSAALYLFEAGIIDGRKLKPMTIDPVGSTEGLVPHRRYGIEAAGTSGRDLLGTLETWTWESRLRIFLLSVDGLAWSRDV